MDLQLEIEMTSLTRVRINDCCVEPLSFFFLGGETFYNNNVSNHHEGKEKLGNNGQLGLSSVPSTKPMQTELEQKFSK